MWYVLAACSAIFLGIYEIFKKVSVDKNAVLPVLLIGTIASSTLYLPLWFLSLNGSIAQDHLLYVPTISAYEHGLILIKTIIVLTSWIFTYFAVKHLPITIVSPIRSTGPLWTLLGAIVIFHEVLSFWQWTGVLLTLVFFYIFSVTGRKEGFSVNNNKWIWFIIIGTIAGSISGLYDKYLLQIVHRNAVQCYFSFYQVAIILPIVLILWLPKRHTTTPFTWRWSIPLIGISLVVADFLYFYALSDKDSLISVVSSLRRGSVIVSFIAGALFFKEKRILQKALFLLAILSGIALMLFGSTK
jgi:transporter family protein